MAGFAPAPLPSLSLVLGENLTLTAAAGSFALSGQAATLSYGSAGSSENPAPLPHLGLNLGPVTGYTGVSDAGAFVLSGVAAGLYINRTHVCAAGAYVLSGQDATLTKTGQNSVEFPASLPHLSLVLTGAAGTYNLPCAVGTFAIGSVDTGLRRGWAVPAGTGAFLWTGAPAQRDLSLTAEAGAFTFAWQDVIGTMTHLPLTSDAGAFTLNGGTASFDYSGGRALLAEMGAFDLAGADATFTYTRSLQCDAGGFVVSGQAATYSTTGRFESSNVGGPRGRRKRHYVEIDGQYFEVRDHDRAVEILTQLHEAAKEAAKAVKKAQKPPAMKIVKPDYKQDFVQDLQAQIDATNAQIAQMWREAEEAQRRADDDADEEDVESLILAGVL